MKKKWILFVVPALLFFCPYTAQASDVPSYYVEAWDLPDGQTAALLEALGLSADDVSSVLGVTPSGALDVLRRIFTSSLPDVLSAVTAVLALLVLESLFLSFCTDKKTAELCEVICAAMIVFALAAFTSRITRSCLSALTVTADFIKALLPIFVGAATLAGDPARALSFQSVMLAFSSGVSAVFSSVLPAAAGVSISLAAAQTVNPDGGCGRAAALLNKLITGAAGMAAGIFVAVLSVKNVVAGAADTVAARGLRFFVGSAVPVVGSAIGEALNSVIAGLGLVKTGVGMLGVLSVALINLFPLCALVQWRLASALLSECAALFQNARTAEFLKALGGLFSVLSAALCFHCVVFIIGLAVVCS
ncbi:MAG: hypothetical protein IJT27_03985 [Clostridia bacterium]|nr:hypothetical protein [Clostridia bacterium]